MKQLVKRMLFGPPGVRPRTIKRGLLRGLRMKIDTQSKSMRLMGFDEREIAADVERLAARCKSACDVGANDGWYTIYFASRPNIERVIAFEPDTKVVPELRENLSLNDGAVAKKVEIVPKLVGEQDDAEWCSLDRVAADLPRPVMLKIDVDGGEMGVLRGGAQLIRSGECVFVIETHTPDLERDCDQFLRDAGYTTRIIDNAWYRKFIPENRAIPHNRWLVATR